MSQIRKTARVSMVLALTLFLCSCGGGGAVAPSPSPMVGNPGTTALMLAASPAALSLPAGASTTFNLGVSPVSYSPVAVTLANAPAGVQVTTNAGAAVGSGQQTETLSVAASVVPNTYAMTLMGTSGSVTGTTSLTLQVEPALPASFVQLEQRTFEYFWNTTNPANGLAPDHYPGSPFASIAATGFALTAYPIGVQNGWITRAQAEQRVLTTLKFFYNAPQGNAASGDTGYQGFFYHFLDLNTGLRYGTTTGLSSMDNALLMAGVLFDASYFNDGSATDNQIQALANALYQHVDWTWMAQSDAPLINLDWTPESGFSPYNWQGYNEAMILYIEALGSPTYPLPASAWTDWTATYPNFWGNYYGREQLSFGPLFGSQYSQAWIDFRGIQDAYMKSKGIDYFINSRRATESQQAYAEANPGGWTGYGADLWGLTACDGPGNFSFTSGNGQTRTFKGYAARGAGIQDSFDDGTIAPTAALGSIVFAPSIVIPTVQAMQSNYGAYILGQYGYYDAFNPSFQYSGVTPYSGAVVPGVGWVDSEYLGIDQGPILLMLENYRSGFVWNVMRQNPDIQLGLQRAGFTGGWLAGTPAVQ
ncbi:MAG: glucoamylase family protein [Metallibacterium sp.]